MFSKEKTFIVLDNRVVRITVVVLIILYTMNAMGFVKYCWFICLTSLSLFLYSFVLSVNQPEEAVYFIADHCVFKEMALSVYHT